MIMTKNESPLVEDGSDGEVSLGGLDLNPPSAPMTPTDQANLAKKASKSERGFGNDSSRFSQLGMAGREESGGKFDVLARACRVDLNFYQIYCGGLVNGASGDKICMKDGPGGPKSLWCKETPEESLSQTRHMVDCVQCGSNWSLRLVAPSIGRRRFTCSL